MKNRHSRAKIAEETVNILDNKTYQTINGKAVDLTGLLDHCVDGAIHYTPEVLSSLLAELSASESEALDSTAVSRNDSTKIEVFNESTFDGAKTLIQQTQSKVLCLNFASAKNPGGGFLGGSQAQEEALTRTSGLYSSLMKFMDMYKNNRKFKSCLYQDHIIYSPNVPVFRDEDDELIEAPWCTSIITAPAVNYGALREEEKAQAELVMRQRIAMVLAVAAKHGYKNLVLGAWGCGVFRNNPQNIAQYFRDALFESEMFKNTFDQIRFSVLDRTNTGTFDTFYKVLTR